MSLYLPLSLLQLLPLLSPPPLLSCLGPPLFLTGLLICTCTQLRVSGLPAKRHSIVGGSQTQLKTENNTFSEK